MIKLSRIYCLLLVNLLAVSVYGQKADAVIDRSEILIGEQAVISLSYPLDKANPEKIQFPLVGDTLMDKVEVVRKSKIDTLGTNAGISTIRLEQKLYITSFDTGYYAIKPFEFKINGQSELTPAFLLTVQTVEIDTTGSIMGDRDVYLVDVTLLDFIKVYWKYPAIALAAVAIVLLILFLIRRYKKHKDEKPKVIVTEPLRPAHELALEALNTINEEKVYKRGKVKAYHTAITDTLRDYLERAYQIPAHELTSHQIITALKYSGIDDREMLRLRTILFRADMVKFAKENPDEAENISAISDAILFVKNTIPTETTSEKTESDA